MYYSIKLCVGDHHINSIYFTIHDYLFWSYAPFSVRGPARVHAFSLASMRSRARPLRNVGRSRMRSPESSACGRHS